nr:unnamed protein product [Callosobruchus chinensis]
MKNNTKFKRVFTMFKDLFLEAPLLLPGLNIRFRGKKILWINSIFQERESKTEKDGAFHILFSKLLEQ